MSVINYANCKSCEARIFFATNPKTSKPLPIDAKPSENGNIRVYFGVGTYAFVSKEGVLKAKSENEQLYQSHFATCKDAKKFRRGK